MLKVLHPNRWLAWTISIIFIVFIYVWGQVTLYAAELEVGSLDTSADIGYVPLGSLAWRSGDVGQTYMNDKSLLREATYPTTWISKEKLSRLYFSNKAHQCALIVADEMPALSRYSLFTEKTVATDGGDIKLTIYKNINAADDQKYLVQSADKEFQKIDDDYVFGLIRVDDSVPCTDTFGKILSTFKISKK